MCQESLAFLVSAKSGFHSLKSVGPWRESKKDAPPHNSSEEEQMQCMHSKWMAENQQKLQESWQEILKKPVCKRPDCSWRFCLKTDWSKKAMGAALSQADPDFTAAKKAEWKEIAGGLCAFDKTLKHNELCLKPCSMMSQLFTKAEQHCHCFLGEFVTGAWAVEKHWVHLSESEFAQLCDCSGVKVVFKQTAEPTHQLQRQRIGQLVLHTTCLNLCLSAQGCVTSHSRCSEL